MEADLTIEYDKGGFVICDLDDNPVTDVCPDATSLTVSRLRDFPSFDAWPATTKAALANSLRRICPNVKILYSNVCFMLPQDWFYLLSNLPNCNQVGGYKWEMWFSEGSDLAPDLAFFVSVRNEMPEREFCFYFQSVDGLAPIMEAFPPTDEEVATLKMDFLGEEAEASWTNDNMTFFGAASPDLEDLEQCLAPACRVSKLEIEAGLEVGRDGFNRISNALRAEREPFHLDITWEMHNNTAGAVQVEIEHWAEYIVNLSPNIWALSLSFHGNDMPKIAAEDWAKPVMEALTKPMCSLQMFYFDTSDMIGANGVALGSAITNKQLEEWTSGIMVNNKWMPGIMANNVQLQEFTWCTSEGPERYVSAPTLAATCRINREVRTDMVFDERGKLRPQFADLDHKDRIASLSFEQLVTILVTIKDDMDHLLIFLQHHDTFLQNLPGIVPITITASQASQSEEVPSTVGSSVTIADIQDTEASQLSDEQVSQYELVARSVSRALLSQSLAPLSPGVSSPMSEEQLSEYVRVACSVSRALLSGALAPLTSDTELSQV